MKSEDLSRGLSLLFENDWIVRDSMPEDYIFLRRNQEKIKESLRERFGMNLTVKKEYIQLFKRPHQLESWMGETKLNSQLDYVLFCYAMAYLEGLEAETPFMMDEIVQDIDMNMSDTIRIDWTNYNNRKSFVRVLKHLLDIKVIEIIQGDTTSFESSEENQEILFVSTSLARVLLPRAPKAYVAYDHFSDCWTDIQKHSVLKENQILNQRLMMEPLIQRTEYNEETFIRLRNYYPSLKKYLEDNTTFSLELYRDYAALTTENRDQTEEVFPSRKVIDEILIQLATILRKKNFASSSYGQIILSKAEWEELLQELMKTFQMYWSKEYAEMPIASLNSAILKRGNSWSLFELEANMMIINPVFGRLTAEMRSEDE